MPSYISRDTIMQLAVSVLVAQWVHVQETPWSEQGNDENAVYKRKKDASKYCSHADIHSYINNMLINDNYQGPFSISAATLIGTFKSCKHLYRWLNESPPFQVQRYLYCRIEYFSSSCKTNTQRQLNPLAPINPKNSDLDLSKSSPPVHVCLYHPPPHLRY